MSQNFLNFRKSKNLNQLIQVIKLKIKIKKYYNYKKTKYFK